jgi:hypothetical protein
MVPKNYSPLELHKRLSTGGRPKGGLVLAAERSARRVMTTPGYTEGGVKIPGYRKPWVPKRKYGKGKHRDWTHHKKYKWKYE